jgi:hypothetical protein
MTDRDLVRGSASAPRSLTRWYVAAAVLSAVGLTAGVAIILSVTSQANLKQGHSVPVGGVVELEQPGPHMVIVTYGASRREEKGAGLAWESAPQASVEVASATSGESLQVRPEFETTQLGETRVAKLASFEVATAGEYVVEVQPSLSPLPIAVVSGKSLEAMSAGILRLVLGWLAGVGLSGASFLTSAAIVMVAFIQSRKRNSKPSGA